MQVPIPGGDAYNMETVPLTPRDTSNTNNEQDDDESSVSSLASRNKGYLSFFRSPRPYSSRRDSSFSASSKASSVYSRSSRLSLGTTNSSSSSTPRSSTKKTKNTSSSPQQDLEEEVEKEPVVVAAVATDVSPMQQRQDATTPPPPYHNDSASLSIRTSAVQSHPLYASHAWPPQPRYWRAALQGWWEERANAAAAALPSPRSRQLANLHYLLQQQKLKLEQMQYYQQQSNNSNTTSQEQEEGFDFCLVLQPQQVYAYWADLLDFRVETLGWDSVQTMEDHWESLFDTILHDASRTLLPAPSQQTSPSSTPHSTTSSSSSSDTDSTEARDVLGESPSLMGMRRRAWSKSTLVTPSRRPSQPQQLLHSSMPSYRGSSNRTLQQQPSPYSMDSRVSNARMSVFDRALLLSSSPTSSANLPFTSDATCTEHSTASSPFQQQPTPYEAAPMSHRRRWGNHQPSSTSTLAGGATVNRTTATPHGSAISPPIRSLTRGTSTVRRPAISRLPSKQQQQKDSPCNHQNKNILRESDIPNQIIPPGIAKRTNGILPFLSALKRGIVLRQHRPHQPASFVLLSSKDGGDTVDCVPVVDVHQAMTAFKEQRVRYNKQFQQQPENIDNNKSMDNPLQIQPWSMDPDEEHNNRFTVPDYVAAQKRRKESHGSNNNINNSTTSLQDQDENNHHTKQFFSWGGARLAQQYLQRSFHFKAADLVDLLPARDVDPRSDDHEYGSATLRQSSTPHDPTLTFSVVLRTRSSSAVPLAELHDRWRDNQGHDGHFRFCDLEAASVGEYWLVLRGLLLLHREVLVGRFAEDRAAGIGNNYSRLEMEQRSMEQDRLHPDEFLEPTTVGYLEKWYVQWREMDTTYLTGAVQAGAVPPPSDYFLGFKSPGTAIWSRLRQAGLETQRLYALDPKSVLIKIRCPADRLFDVAEVLRLNLKTHDGSFCPFREEMIGLYQDLDDPLEMNGGSGFQFRSSFRQTIIDFIIGSRIRDTGAELVQTTDLGKMIQARVPLHMPRKLEAIYQSWVFFWRAENWQNGRDGRSMTHPPAEFQEKESAAMTVRSGSGDEEDSVGKDFGDDKEEEMPSWIKRFCIGCFHQPLDSIEQYFGEKVAFYFAWLQHTAVYLCVLAVVGFILFICQVASGNADHPLRPWFAFFVMMWTFVVLINWRKRAKTLAFHWGTMDYKEQETTRPQFRGDYIRDEITNEWVVTYPQWKRWLKYCISFPLTLLFTGGTLVLILLVHSNRDLQLSNYVNQGPEVFKWQFGFEAIGQKQIVEMEVTRENLADPRFWFIVIGMPSLLGLFLPLLNFLLMRLSILLNDFENYRTESEYRSFLIIKVFSFRFVCYFATLYYYAFVSIGDPLAVKNGILRVGTGVLVYTTVAQWWQNFLHVCFPICVRKIRMKYRSKRLARELRDIEIEEEEISRLALTGTTDDADDLKKRQLRVINKRLLLEQAQDETWLELMNPQHDSFPEYIQAVVQFTFVSCFSVVLPITPLICLINYLLSMRLDAYKLCKGRRRPLAEKTGGIGVWEHLLHIVAVISILTNCWLMGFTSSQLTWIGTEVSYIAQFAVVVGWEHVMLLVKYVMQTSISPLPQSVRDAMKREQHELSQQRNASMMARRLQHQREESFRGLQQALEEGKKEHTQ